MQRVEALRRWRREYRLLERMAEVPRPPYLIQGCRCGRGLFLAVPCGQQAQCGLGLLVRGRQRLELATSRQAFSDIASFCRRFKSSMLALGVFDNTSAIRRARALYGHSKPSLCSL